MAKRLFTILIIFIALMGLAASSAFADLGQLLQQVFTTGQQAYQQSQQQKSANTSSPTPPTSSNSSERTIRTPYWHKVETQTVDFGTATVTPDNNVREDIYTPQGIDYVFGPPEVSPARCFDSYGKKGVIIDSVTLSNPTDFQIVRNSAEGQLFPWFTTGWNLVSIRFVPKSPGPKMSQVIVNFHTTDAGCSTTGPTAYTLVGTGKPSHLGKGYEVAGDNWQPPPSKYRTSPDITSFMDADQFVEDNVGTCPRGSKNCPCAALTHELAPWLPSASQWIRGDQVEGNMNIPIGTPIATFNYYGDHGTNGYGSEDSPGGESGTSHTGIYMGTAPGNTGILILNQWNGQDPKISFIPWSDFSGNEDEGGSRYYTIKNGNGKNEK